MKQLIYFIFLQSILNIAIANDEACDSFKVSEPSIDLSPLSGYVEVCKKNQELCEVLTSGYPPSTKTLGYFISANDWSLYEKGINSGFSNYLIAQLSKIKPQEFIQLKDHILSKNGQIPDNTDLPSFLKSQSNVNLGVLSDHKNSITIGNSQTIVQNNPPMKTQFTILASNTAILVKDSVLSLYVYSKLEKDSDLDKLKFNTEQWLQCIDTSNP